MAFFGLIFALPDLILRIVIENGFDVEPHVEHKHVKWESLQLRRLPYVDDIKELIIKHRYEVDKFVWGHKKLSAHPPHDAYHPVFELKPGLTGGRSIIKQIWLGIQLILNGVKCQLFRKYERKVFRD